MKLSLSALLIQFSKSSSWKWMSPLSVVPCPLSFQCVNKNAMWVKAGLVERWTGLGESLLRGIGMTNDDYNL